MSNTQPRTLEQRLKFDFGLTIETVHPVRFRKGEGERAALVYIPRRGYPRVTIRNEMYVTTNKVKGDNMETVGVQTTWQHGAEFDQKTAAPAVIIDL